VPGTTVFAAAARRPAPDVSARTLDGGVLRLRDVAGGRVVVVNVWASWCTSCREESAVLADAARSAAGARFVGVDEADSVPAARRFVAATGADYPQVLDPDGELLQRLTVLPSTAIPSTLVLDPQGRMAARVIGPVTRSGLNRLLTTLQREG
jgi:peroxiredoxin